MLAARLAQPIHGPGDACPSPKRDIYLIVLDEYAELRACCGSGSATTTGRSRTACARSGFHIPRVVRSNYAAHAALAPLHAQLRAPRRRWSRSWAPRPSIPALPNHLLEHNRVARVPRGAGLPLRLLPLAVVALDQRQRARGQSVPRRGRVSISPGRCTGGELQRTVRGASILRYLRPGPPVGGGARAPDAARGRRRCRDRPSRSSSSRTS